MPMRILTVTGTAPRGLAHRGPDDVVEQPDAPRQRRPAALAGHLGHRAAEVQVDVVGEVLVDDHPHGRADDGRVDAVELHASAASRRARSGSSAASSRCARPARGVVIISQTNSPPAARRQLPAMTSRHSRRNAVLVMPAIGASTTGGSATTASDSRSGANRVPAVAVTGGQGHGTSVAQQRRPAGPPGSPRPGRAPRAPASSSRARARSPPRSSRVSKSTVTQNGVPISSCRR